MKSCSFKLLFFFPLMINYHHPISSPFSSIFIIFPWFLHQRIIIHHCKCQRRRRFMILTIIDGYRLNQTREESEERREEKKRKGEKQVYFIMIIIINIIYTCFSSMRNIWAYQYCYIDQYRHFYFLYISMRRWINNYF